MNIEKTKRYQAKGQCDLISGKVAYDAITEEYTVFDNNQEAEATLYTIAYKRSDCGDNTGRPILFAYNGGPGSASATVNLCALAPEKIRFGDLNSISFTPPYKMENNPDTVLDICDIVLIDPVNCGFSRLLKESAADKYFSSDKDAIITVQLITKWLTVHKRWNSPIYLMGESYGTIRNALVADKIFYNESQGICSANTLHLSGVIMLGTALDHGQIPFPVDTAVLNFTSIAATNWLHHRDGKPSRDEFLSMANDFAYRDYLPALALGQRITHDEREHIKDRLEYFTGLSSAKIEELNLRIETKDYPLIGFTSDGFRVSRYDGRIKMNVLKDISNYDMFADDAISACIMPAINHCFNAIWREKLNIDNDDVYDGLNVQASEHWDFHTSKAPVKALEDAMKRNPDMKVMFCTGYYDMVTTLGYTEYLISAYDIPRDRTKCEAYESGHMPYLGQMAAEKFGNDMHDFINWRKD